MAITLGNGTFNSTNSSTTSVSSAFTGTPTTNDLLIAIQTSVGVTSGTTISGWTEYQTVNVSASVYTSLFYKVSAGNEGTITASNASATAMSLAILDLSGAAYNAVTVATSSSLPTQSGNTTLTETAVTSSTTGSVAISYAGVANNNGGSATWTNGGSGSANFAGTATIKTMGLYYINSSTFSSYAPTVTWVTSRGNGGGIVVFAAIFPPTVTDSAATSITTTTATCPGNITSQGGGTVSAAGIAYATTSNPTTSNSTVSTGTTSGAYNCNLTGLTPNTLYHFRAYATNEQGTSYGSDTTFTTLSNARFGSTLSMMGVG